MCGIAGIASIHHALEPQWIFDMTQALSHRGPDDEGFLAINAQTKKTTHLTGPDSRVNGEPLLKHKQPGHVWLGHRRLSIIDPTPRGHQPMQSRDKRLWLIFNGEIYNYIELKETLMVLGHTFETTSDTEVLLAAYQQWGQHCIDHFDGMWAFVIYDTQHNILFGARDRFGVKPFYYYHEDGYFTFASEIKALTTLPFIEKKINADAVFDFLAFGGQPFMEESFFKGIMELGPSHAFSYHLQSGEFKIWKYFTLNYNRQSSRFNPGASHDYIEQIRHLLLKSVEMRLRSDVPVGSALSGGLDSSAIVCCIGQLLQSGNRQQVFTASFPGSDVDESQWAKLAAEKSSATQHLTFPRGSEFIEDLEDLAYTQELPFASPSIYAQYRVMKLASENNIKVLLDGQGADELFTGYTIYYDVFFYQMLRHGNIKNFLNEYRHLENSPLSKGELRSALFKQIRRQLIPDTFLKRIRSSRKRQPHYSYINPEFWNQGKERLELMEQRDFNALNPMLFEFFTRQKLSALLRYEDRNSMRFSVESRTPFADNLDLIQYVFNIPAVYKIHNGWSKYLLREAMQGILPEDIRLRRDKKGFDIPNMQWLEENKEPLSLYLDTDLEQFINMPMVRRHLDNGMKDISGQMVRTMWSIISLGAWLKVFVNKT